MDTGTGKGLGGRPLKDKELKSKRLTVTIPPETHEFLGTIENKSHFVASAVEFFKAYLAQSKVYDALDEHTKFTPN